MQALILAGGSGTRFWPLSRQQKPKQLIALEGERSLLQTTVDRLMPLIAPSDVWISTTVPLGAAVKAALPEVPAAQVLCEPEGRNTAPAIGWALGCMAAAGRGDEIVAVLSSDHRIVDLEAFRAALVIAERLAAEERIVTLGIKPRWAETGYGYLELGEVLEAGVHRVACFHEKPDGDKAARYHASGHHLWNAGIFIFKASILLEHLRRLEPELAAGLDLIASAPERLSELYGNLKKISIDFAVMEHLDSIAAVALDAGWSDLGSFEALAEVLPADDAGNFVRGDVLALEAHDNVLFAEQGQIAVLGLDDLIVVRTGTTVLIAPRRRAQDVKILVDELNRRQRTDVL